MWTSTLKSFQRIGIFVQADDMGGAFKSLEVEQLGMFDDGYYSLMKICENSVRRVKNCYQDTKARYYLDLDQRLINVSDFYIVLFCNYR